MNNISRVKSAQTRAKKLIKQYEDLGWEIKTSVKSRAYMELPNRLSDKQAQALVDNLSAETIRVTRKMTQNVRIHETEPITKGNYRSGAKIFDVVKMQEPTTRSKDISFDERNIVPKTMEQIRFVLENAPNRQVAEKIERRLWAIELRGGKIFETEDIKKRQSDVLGSIISESALKESVKKAESQGYPATQALTTLYEDLVGEYGQDERGLAARQMEQFKNTLETVGYDYSTDPVERATIADVLYWMIENASVWDAYRKQFKLKKIFHQTYDSDSVLSDVTEVLVDNPQYKMKILQKLIELMSRGTQPEELLENLEAYVEELEDAANRE